MSMVVAQCVAVKTGEWSSIWKPKPLNPGWYGISNHETRCMGMEIEMRWMDVTMHFFICHFSDSDFFLWFIIFHERRTMLVDLLGRIDIKCPKSISEHSKKPTAARKTFLVIGFLFGLGDYLEMRSLVSLNGGAYQILLQSRLLITALMLWAISGQRQTLFQWNLLALVVCSMSVYMCSWPASAWTVFNWLFLTMAYNFLQSFLSK